MNIQSQIASIKNLISTLILGLLLVGGPAIHLTGLLDYFNDDVIELSENTGSDSEKEEKKEEKESDEYTHHLNAHALVQQVEVHTFYWDHESWETVHLDIFSPPPEQV